MLYFTHGTDRDKIRLRSNDIITALLAKKPDATLIRFDSENLIEPALEECLGGQGLFERKFIVEISHVFENEDIKGFIPKWIKDMSESDNVFVWKEAKVDAKTLKKIDRYATKTQNFNSSLEVKKKKTGKESFNIFDFGDALGRKDKKGLWVLLQKARYLGFSAEEIHGTLHWQARSILAVTFFPKSTSAELGMSPYVYKKAQGFSRNFNKETIRGFSRKLLEIHNEARAGGDVLDIALEKFLLSL